MDAESDSKYMCSRKCLLRTVLLIKTFKDSTILLQVLWTCVMHTVTMVKLISKTPAVYTHNSNRFTRRIGEKTALLKTDGKSQPYFITLSHCGFLHCGNSTSRMRGTSPLSFESDHFSSGKAKAHKSKVCSC